MNYYPPAYNPNYMPMQQRLTQMEQTTQAARQVGIQFASFNMYDWYYTLNMMWSDYSNVFGNDSNTYISLAKAWLNDPDVPEGKAWRYYKYVVKA